MRVYTNRAIVMILALISFACTPSMSPNELKIYMANESGLNRNFSLDGDSISVRYIPQAAALKQGLETEGHYFELRASEIETLYKLSEQNFSIYSPELQLLANLLFIENYGGGMSNRAILCFNSRPNLENKLTLRYKSVGVGMLQDINFDINDIESANRINLAL